MRKRNWIIPWFLILSLLGGCTNQTLFNTEDVQNGTIREEGQTDTVGEERMKASQMSTTSSERTEMFETVSVDNGEKTEEFKQDTTEYITEDFLNGTMEESTTEHRISLGLWDYVTFSNIWSNIKMTVPENAAIFMREQFPLFVTIKENQIWDTILMLNDWDSSIYIYYEKKKNDIDIDTFLQQKFEELEAPEDLENQINGKLNVTLGSDQYRKLETSIRNDKYTDFYVREKDGYFIVIQTKSTPFKREEIKHIIETITSASEE